MYHIMKIGIQYIYCCRDTEYRICEITSELDETTNELLRSYADTLDLEYDGNPFIALFKKHTITSGTKDIYNQCDYKDRKSVV